MCSRSGSDSRGVVKFHVVEELPELVLGTLDPVRAKAVEKHLRGCAACTRARRSLGQTIASLPMSLPPVAPPLTAWQRLESGLSGGGRFSHFAPRVAELFDISEDAARRLFDALMDPAAWQEGPAPGVSVILVEPGPKRRGAFSAFVRIPAGVTYPMHRHTGEELNLVLQGGFRERGHDVWRGELVRETKGSSHAQLGLPGVDCIAATVLDGEIVLGPVSTKPKRRTKARTR
jgi:putative transcriptional regulator